MKPILKMAEEIINRIASSKLKTFDLEEIYPEGKRVLFDIKEWLFQEIILKEKDFRASVKNHDYPILGFYVNSSRNDPFCK